MLDPETVSPDIVRGRWWTRMPARSPHESHRVATPLELFFDLVFVVAIAQAANGLHHAVAELHPLEGLLGYLLVFFALWWAWMAFTWFASAYDCDDTPYRLLVFVQISGALLLAAGIPALFEERVANVAVIGGYVVMRVSLIIQWLRAAASDPERRTTAYRYAAGLAVVQILWGGILLVPQYFWPVFLTLVALDVSVPLWAESAAPTTWHPHHIAERYGLLTMIVLGESILAATTAIQSALASGEAVANLAPLIVGGLLIVYSMWWLYFRQPVHDLLTSFRKAFIWGYGHYFVFASAAAVGAGLAAAVDAATHHAKVGPVGAGFAVAVPVATYLICLWLLHDRPEYQWMRMSGPVAAVLVLLAPFTGMAVPLIGLILAALVAIKVVVYRHEEPRVAH